MPETASPPSPPTRLAPLITRPRLGFAGVGWIGRNRLEAIARSGLADIRAIVDPVADAATKAVELAPGAEAGTDFDALLAGDLDGIVIATPSALHASQAIAALRAGKAVFCQKPLARTAEETREVLSTARSANRLLGVDLSYRFTAGMQQIRTLIAAGELGEIYGVELVFHNAYGPDKAWFYDRQLAGGGCLLDLGTHLIDLSLWALGNPAVGTVCGDVRAAGRDALSSVEDYASAQFTVAGGAVVRLACSWKVPAGYDARIEATFFGSKGGASFRNVDGSFYDFVAEHHLPDRSSRVLSAPPDAWGGRAAVAWVQRLALSTAFDPQIAHLETVATTIDRIYGRAL